LIQQFSSISCYGIEQIDLVKCWGSCCTSSVEEEKYLKGMKELTEIFGLSVVFWFCFFFNSDFKRVDPIIPSACIISVCTLICWSHLLSCHMTSGVHMRFSTWVLISVFPTDNGKRKDTLGECFITPLKNTYLGKCWNWKTQCLHTVDRGA